MTEKLQKAFSPEAHLAQNCRRRGRVVLLFLIILGILWSPMPRPFWVNQYVDDDRAVVGYSTTDTLIRVAGTLLDKRGGYLSNDKFPPGLWLDNMPNWEQGVLTQVSDLAPRHSQRL